MKAQVRFHKLQEFPNFKSQVWHEYRMALEPFKCHCNQAAAGFILLRYSEASHILQIWAPAPMCYFGMALSHRLGAVDKPKGFGMAGGDAYIGLLQSDQLLFWNSHAMTPHASRTRS